MNSKCILEPRKVNQKLERIALEMIERTNGELILAGIENMGYHVASKIGQHLQTFTGKNYPVYRIHIDKQDPLSVPLQTDVPYDSLNKATLIIVDDVQNSGRTMMYSIRHFLQFPVLSLQTCVLVDRKHHSFPVTANYVGISLSTTLQEHVLVEHSSLGFEVLLE